MQITDPYFFYVPAGLLLTYLIYMMIRKREGERPGTHVREPEL